MNYYPFIIALIIIIFVLAYCQNVYEYYTTDINDTDAYKKGNWKNEAELLDTRINELQEEIEKDPNNDILRKELQSLKNNRDFNKRFMENTNFKDVDFHDSIEDIMSQTGYQYTLLSSDSHLIRDPSKLRYKSSNFVPTYEDSVFLSRLSDISHSKPVNDSAELKGGFCDFHKHNPLAIERKCIHLDKDVCGSTSCCVLLGGSKCVSGNENGPFMKSNYNDSTIKNNDHYYRDGKCYGNCPGNEPPYQTY
jgi:hypothetical protein